MKILGTLLAIALSTLAACGKQPTSSALKDITMVQGNGTDKLECGEYSGVADLYYAFQQGFRPDLGPDSLTVLEKVNVALVRIKDLDPTRFKTLSAYAEFFYNEAVIADDLSISHEADQDVVIPLPKGQTSSPCFLVNIVTQITNPLPTQKHYYIEASSWKTLTQDNQAALILHEIVYREAASHENMSNRGVLEFVSRLLGNQFVALDRSRYSQFLTEYTRLPAFYKEGEYLYDLSSIELYGNGNLKKGQLLSPSAKFNVKNNRLIVNAGSLLEFYENGIVARVTAQDSSNDWQYVDFQGNPPVIRGEKCRLSPTSNITKLAFYEDGALQTFAQAKPIEVDACFINPETAPQDFFVEGDLSFYPSGSLEAATYKFSWSTGQWILMTEDGESRTMTPGAPIHFDTNGWYTPRF